MNRCKWCNLNNPLYVSYHDLEWGVLNRDSKYLFEMLILESFMSGLSWEVILNKRKDFEIAYDNFDILKVSHYDSFKIESLLHNEKIIRNKLKIEASITNAIIFQKIEEEFGSFFNYLNTYFNGKILYESGKTENEISLIISKDLKKRGMKFLGSKTIYSYLAAIGLINAHDINCYLYKKLI